MVTKTETNLHLDPLRAPLTAVLAFIDKYVVQKKSSRRSQFSLFRAALRMRIHGSFDILHFPWTPGIFNFKKSARLNSKVIFTLHDDFLFTGGCHSAGACIQYQTGCQQCPMVRAWFRPLVKSQAAKKAVFFKQLDRGLILAPTNWMMGRALKSHILAGKTLTSLSNLLNPVFIDTKFDCDRVNFESRVKVGFIAANISDPNKNLKRVLSVAKLDETLTFEIVGNSANAPATAQIQNLEVKGELGSSALAEVAKNWDWLFLPSFEENSPQVINEMACLGVPTLTFGVGATGEMIDRLGEGQVISADASDDTVAHFLRKKISSTSRQKLSKRARELFGSELLAKTWLERVLG